jgi:hypothetical protein
MSPPFKLHAQPIAASLDFITLRILGEQFKSQSTSYALS